MRLGLDDPQPRCCTLMEQEPSPWVLISNPLLVLFNILFSFKKEKLKVKLSTINCCWLRPIGEEVNKILSFLFHLGLGHRKSSWWPITSMLYSREMRASFHSCNFNPFSNFVWQNFLFQGKWKIILSIINRNWLWPNEEVINHIPSLLFHLGLVEMKSKWRHDLSSSHIVGYLRGNSLKVAMTWFTRQSTIGLHWSMEHVITSIHQFFSTHWWNLKTNHVCKKTKENSSKSTLHSLDHPFWNTILYTKITKPQI